MNETNISKLLMVKTEIVTLLGRLTQPYRGNMEEAAKLVDDVIDNLKMSGE
jgi:hypothetical protein